MLKVTCLVPSLSIWSRSFRMISGCMCPIQSWLREFKVWWILNEVLVSLPSFRMNFMQTTWFWARLPLPPVLCKIIRAGLASPNGFVLPSSLLDGFCCLLFSFSVWVWELLSKYSELNCQDSVLVRRGVGIAKRRCRPFPLWVFPLPSTRLRRLFQVPLSEGLGALQQSGKRGLAVLGGRWDGGGVVKSCMHVSFRRAPSTPVLQVCSGLPRANASLVSSGSLGCQEMEVKYTRQRFHSFLLSCWDTPLPLPSGALPWGSVTSLLHSDVQPISPLSYLTSRELTTLTIYR